MSLDTQVAARIITDAVAAAQAAPAAAALAPADGGNALCSIWPQAKPLLELASTVLTFVPGAGPVAGPVLTGLIKIGDQIYAENCA